MDVGLPLWLFPPIARDGVPVGEGTSCGLRRSHVRFDGSVLRRMDSFVRSLEISDVTYRGISTVGFRSEFCHSLLVLSTHQWMLCT